MILTTNVDDSQTHLQAPAAAPAGPRSLAGPKAPQANFGSRKTKTPHGFAGRGLSDSLLDL